MLQIPTVQGDVVLGSDWNRRDGQIEFDTLNVIDPGEECYLETSPDLPPILVNVTELVGVSQRGVLRVRSTVVSTED